MSAEKNPCYLAYLSAFDIIAKLRESGASLRPINLVNELIPFLQEKLTEQNGKDFNIILEPKKWVGGQIFGALLRYADHVKILYSMDLNTCWRRFVVAKELSHLLFDSTESYTTDPAELVTSLLSEIPLSDGPSAQATSEQLAAIMAIELLLPHQEREKIESLFNSGVSVRRIALDYRVPAKIVEAFLSAEYRNVAISCWDGLRGNNAA